jgi:hypothetical protein
VELALLARFLQAKEAVTALHHKYYIIALPDAMVSFVATLRQGENKIPTVGHVSNDFGPASALGLEFVKVSFMYNVFCRET